MTWQPIFGGAEPGRLTYTHRAPKVALVNVAIGGRYPAGSARLVASLAKFAPASCEIMPYVDRLPPGAPEQVIEDGYDYTGYCAKPFALRAAMNSGADIGILVDASIVAIRDISPLVEHIRSTGYYLAPAGFTVEEWSSDRALEFFGMKREDAVALPDCASGCVGIDFRRVRGRKLVEDWCASWPSFAGHHSNANAACKKHSYRNVGFVSTDPAVRGHRHDQTALSILAHRAGMTDWIPWPKFVAYEAGYGGHANEDTVFLIKGAA